MLARKEGIGLEERRRGAASGVEFGVIDFLFVLLHADLRNHCLPCWPVAAPPHLRPLRPQPR